MAIATKSYNPGFLTDDELRHMFCVRVGEFESLLETLRENTGASNQHVVVVGPRGSGKTTLLLRVALEVRSDPELSSRLYPIVFAEESYSVSSCGEFWLECLSRLAQQVPRSDREPDLRRTLEDIRQERNDRVLRERCLGALLDFADREGKRLVLHVENLDMLFSDMMDPDAGWCLRKTLQTEPRIMLMGSATSRFGEIDRPDRPLYDLFRVLSLQPLDRKESAILCKSVSGKAVDDGVARRLQILTGGSPRLLAVVARFGAARSFRTLLSDLLDLVDEHTAYFKSHLESLPPQERRVYLALAELWKPATAREVGERARMETSKCSAQLRRLVGRGVVSNEGGTDRRKLYYVSERLYNIYYLLRRSRGMDSLVGALVQFMDAYYSPSELQGLVDEMVGELGNVDPYTRLIYEAALHRFSGLPALAWHFYRTHREHLPDEVRATTETASKLLERAGDKFEKGNLRGALRVLAELLQEMDRAEDALAAYDELYNRFGASESVDILAPVVGGQVNKAATLFGLRRLDEALAVCEETWHRFGNHGSFRVFQPAWTAMSIKSAILSVQGRIREHLAICEELLNRLDRLDQQALAGKVADYDAAAAFTLRLATHRIRIITYVRAANVPAVVDDVQAILQTLPRLAAIQTESIHALMSASFALGIDQLAVLIRESPAANHLLPLTTALELEMGEEPRVAIEVRRVAEDMQQELAKIRELFRKGEGHA